MNYSDHIQNKRYNITNSQTNNLMNNSIIRQTKSLVENGNKNITINPDIFNSNIKYYYTINNDNANTNQLYTSGNQFPLLLYNSNGGCSIDNLKDTYAISKINAILEHLKNDEIDIAFANLTTDETQKILYDLHDIKQKVGECFHSIITMYQNIFKSIRYFYFLEGELRSQQTNCEKYKEDSTILNDIQKLKEYIAKMQLNINSLTTVNVKSKNLNVKPEYVKYIQLYGLPHKVMFNEVLLQEIKDSIYNN